MLAIISSISLTAISSNAIFAEPHAQTQAPSLNSNPNTDVPNAFGEGAHYLGQSLPMGRHSSDFLGEHGLGLGNALQDKKKEKLKE